MHDPTASDATEIEGTPRAAPDDAALAPGARLGPYIIRRVLGEGGMGRVYLAEQTAPVRREVALKLIRDQVASPLARAYFEVERQALAQMQHPAIAQVFDAGTTPEGFPYLAMELVEGAPITRFCRDESLDRAQRLALFARVCHGVQHAHQKGVIHRDLKPANVLVRRIDGTPSPKIIDFGIAVGGAVSERGVVAANASTERAGTAIYMSPEQAAGGALDIDTRSDVYSLGVMLFEILTDSEASALTSAAYKSGQALHATLLAVDGMDASSAPAPEDMLDAARELPSELRAILRKALAPDRADRYDSAVALAEDIERFATRRPLRAVPATRWYLARKFLSRHRVGITAAGAAAIALIVGAALAVRGEQRATLAANEARVEAAKAQQVADFVREMLAGIDPDRAEGMDRSLMRLVLDSAAERASRELATQPAVRSSIERTIGDSYMGIGEYALAEQHIRAALDASPNATPAQRARMMSRLAELASDRGARDESVKLGNDSVAVASVLPEDDRDRLIVEGTLAWIDCEIGKLEECQALYTKLYERERKALGEEDEETLNTLRGLARAASDLGRYDQARPLYKTLIERNRAHFGERNSKTLSAMNGLGVVENEQKHFADAEKLFTPMLPIYEQVYGADHPATMTIVNNLGGAIRGQGRNEEARPLYVRTLQMAHDRYGDDSYRTVLAMTNLGDLQRDTNNLVDAERLHRDAAARAEKALGPDNAYRGVMYDEYGLTLVRMKRYPDAERELLRAYGVLSAGLGAGHQRTLDVIDHCIELYAAWGKTEKVDEWNEKKRLALAATPNKPAP